MYTGRRQKQTIIEQRKRNQYKLTQYLYSVPVTQPNNTCFNPSVKLYYSCCDLTNERCVVITKRRRNDSIQIVFSLFTLKYARVHFFTFFSQNEKKKNNIVFYHRYFNTILLTIFMYHIITQKRDTYKFLLISELIYFSRFDIL